MKLMLEDKDIQKLVEVFATREELNVELTNIKEDLKEARKERQTLEKRINDTYDAVDGFIKIVTKLEQEFTIMKKDVDKIKEVIKEKLGVDLS